MAVMRSILRLFGQSPFVPLQLHIETVSKCVEKVPTIVDAYRQRDTGTVHKLAEEISKLEHKADLIKHDIRDSLPRGLFLPVRRADLLSILNIQDSIANRAENIGVLLTFKQINMLEEIDQAFDEFVKRCLETFWLARELIDQLDELLEAGFGGAEAVTVRELAKKVSKMEYASDVTQRELAKIMFANEEATSYGDFFLLTRLIRQVAEIADKSDFLASAVRSTLEGN